MKFATFLPALILLGPVLTAPDAGARPKMGPRRIGALRFESTPVWLKDRRVRRVLRKVERFLEWDLRPVKVRWISSQADFLASHGLGSTTVLATTAPDGATITMGPRVTTRTFDWVMGHEIAHAVMIQKYKDAIPRWLNEGLANLASGKKKADLNWLRRNRSKIPKDVTQMGHPFRSPHPDVIYKASTALMQMIAERCPIRELLQLSVQSRIERYLKTYCRIPDLNRSFREWLDGKGKKKFWWQKKKRKRAAD